MDRVNETMPMRLTKDRAVVLLTFVAALTALGTAWTAQYGFGLYPCELCLYQRLPYIGITALCVLALIPAVDSDSRRLAIYVAAGLFLTTAGIAAYHVGVEQGWWQSSCAPVGPQTFSMQDIQSALQRPGTPACDDVPFTLFGISMAGYNMLAGVILAGLATWAAKQDAYWRTP